jgi:hypothetical protein
MKPVLGRSTPQGGRPQESPLVVATSWQRSRGLGGPPGATYGVTAGAHRGAARDFFESNRVFKRHRLVQHLLLQGRSVPQHQSICQRVS